MKNYGFIRTAAAVPTVKVADVTYNTAEICRLAGEAFEKEVSLVVFPELSLTGSSCGDLRASATEKKLPCLVHGDGGMVR